MTITHINNKAPLLPISYLGKQFVKHQRDVKWNVHVAKGEVYIRGFWKKSNRIIMANFKKVKDGHVYTYATVRPGYAKHVYKEVLDLNFYSHQYFNKTAKKTVFHDVMNWFALPSAHAQAGDSISDLLQQGSGSGIENILGDSDIPIDVTGDINVDGSVNVNGQVGVTYQMDQDQYNGLIQESQNLQGTVTDAAENAANTVNSAVDDATNTLNESVNTAADTVDKNADKFVEESKRWNKTAEKAVDIKHMSKLAFAMSASAVMGGYVANLAISGFGSAVAAIIEFFTEDKLRAMRLADFANAKKMFGPLEAITENLEETMDKFISGHDYLANLDGKDTEDVLARLKAEQDQKIADLTDQIDSKQTSRPCKIQLRILRDKEMNSLSDIQNVMEYVAKQGDDVISDVYFCERLDEMMNNIVDAEWQLFSLKSTILDARSFVYQNLQEQVENMDERIERLNSKKNKKRVVSALEDFYDELEDI
jgi:hypothetical protein